VSENGGAPPQSLGEALGELVEVARAAGLDAGAARAEGAALAAAVAESAPRAAQDWAEQLGSTVQGFFEAASSARRWRDAPTALLSGLAAARSAQAPDYARALVEVCAAACGLGEPTMRVVGNASVTSAAQLRAAGIGPPQVGGLGGGPGGGLGAAPGGFGGGTTPSRPGADVLAELNRLNELSTFLPGGLLGGSGSPGGVPGGGPGVLEGGPGSGPGDVPGGAPVGAAATQQQAVAAQVAAQPAAKPKTLEELLGELDELTGLERVKSEVHRQAQVLRIEQLRAAAKLRSATITRHLVFLGNPGTGKTTVARLVSGIYRAIGLLSKGQLVEVDRSELVAGYLGQTATKTAEVVAKAIGGVLFIDEAYALAGDHYGEEAIDTLVKEMEDHRDDLVVIVAGYPVPMASFIAANPGLASRFRTVIAFDDYTDDELVRIFTRLAADSDYAPSPDCLGRFRELLRATPRGEGFGNGRFARNTLEGAVARQAWRLRDVAEPSVDQLRELLPDDLTDPVPDPAAPDASDPAAPDASDPAAPDPAAPDPGAPDAGALDADPDPQPGTEPGPQESPPQTVPTTPPNGPAPASEGST
jgi:Holliday junction resolvasome RuvABC ATP-dependent DNA helicase subunit